MRKARHIVHMVQVASHASDVLFTADQSDLFVGVGVGERPTTGAGDGLRSGPRRQPAAESSQADAASVQAARAQRQ